MFVCLLLVALAATIIQKQTPRPRKIPLDALFDLFAKVLESRARFIERDRLLSALRLLRDDRKATAITDGDDDTGE